MKVLITGASGFIGSRTLRALYSHAIDLKIAGRSGEPPTEIVGQIDSKTDWNRALEGVDTIVHLAAFAHGKNQSDKEFYEINFEGTRNLAAQGKKNGVNKFIYLGSIGSVRRASDIPLRETDTPEPDTPYTISKYYGEEAVRDIFPKHNTILRAPSVFGKGCKGNLKTLLKLRNMPIPLKDDAIRALIDVDSLSNYLVQSVIKEPLGTVHVANPDELTIREVTDIMGVKTIRSPKLLFSSVGAIGDSIKFFGLSSPISTKNLIPLYESLRVSTELQSKFFGDPSLPLSTSLKKWVLEETS